MRNFIGYVPDRLAKRQRKGWFDATIIESRPAWLLGGSEFNIRLQGGYAGGHWKMDCSALGVQGKRLRAMNLQEAKVEALKLVEHILGMRVRAFAALVGNPDDESGRPYTSKIGNGADAKSGILT